MSIDNRLLVIVGPTASGKTDLSIKLAKKHNGGVISADSRQVYKGMDIGSGKVTKKEMMGVPHYLLDVANPKRKFSASQYQKLAIKAIKQIQKKGKLPILVGGTGFYIQSIVEGTVIPEVKPDWALRQKLEKIALPDLVKRLKKLDPVRAGQLDQNNPRRVIRALEIALKLKKVPPVIIKKPDFNVLEIGILKTKENLKKNIHLRLEKRLVKNALINEVKKLRKTLSFKRLEEFGLEYRFVAQYLQNKLSFQEMKDRIEIESYQYAKRQMTWFKRDKNIRWINKEAKATQLVDKFLK